jgi:uncharacterized protein (TIRG00374 family)
VPSPRSQRAAIVVLGALGSAVFIYLAARKLDFQAVAATWHTAQPLPWVAYAVLCYFAGQLLRGLRLRVLVRRETALPWLTATNIIVIGYASNNVFPARLGELVRAGVLVERTGMPFGEALTITFIERLLDGMAILVLLVVAAAFSVHADTIDRVAKLGAILFGGALLVVVIGVLVPNVLLGLASRLTAPLGAKWRDRALRVTTHIINGGACLRDPRTALAVSLLSVVVWVLEAAMFVCVLPAFGLPFSFSLGTLAMSVTNFGILVPSTPGYIGPFHYFCQQTLMTQGIPAAQALAYAVLVHLTFYVLVTAWGAAAILRYGVEIGRTVAAARAARTAPSAKTVGGVPMHFIAHVEPAHVTAEPGELMIALAEAFLPGCEPRAARDVAAFMEGQIAALPPSLRTMFHLGMTFFRFTVRARYVSSFCGLPVDRRRALVDAWAFGRIGLLRQLFRPVRSLAVLAYYERPEVVRALAPRDSRPHLAVVGDP